MGLRTGEIVDGKYRIVRLIGEGGMGAVYEGENTRIHRRVAIKVLHSEAAQAKDAVQRFEREAQAAGRIGNQHIVEVLDLGNLPDGDRYMVMEFLDGESLAERIRRRGNLSPSEVCPLALQILEGLAAAHDAGIVHRDLKPDNVFLIKRGAQLDFVKLVDFGISKFGKGTAGSDFSMTRTGAVMGTPYYMAPEQAKGGRDIDHRVDLYALGVILYEMLTGRVPFEAETFNELLFKIVLEDTPSVLSLVPTLDPSFAAIVDKARAKDPAQRYQTARDLQQALAQWSSGTADAQASWAATERPPPTVGGGATLGKLTADAWASSGENDLGAGKGKRRLVLAAGAGALLLLGGIAMLLKGADEEKAHAARAAAEQAASEERARAAAMQAEAKILKEEAERARLAAEQQVKQAEAEAAKAREATPTAPKATPLTGQAAATAPRPAAPAAASAAKPAAPKSAPASSGPHRKIRTSL